MSRIQSRNRFDPWLLMKKWALSGFVIFTFIAYVIDQRLASVRQASTSQPPAQSFSQGGGTFGRLTTEPQVQQFNPQPAPQAQLQPLPTSAPPSTPNGQYRDGTYTGQPADAFFGNVQVQVVVAGGKLSDVQVLQYPNDRRTSRMINSQALPWLVSEAIHAQNANVNYISGATLTSDAFIQSLDSALRSAKG